jgi:hypothetical protein
MPRCLASALSDLTPAPSADVAAGDARAQQSAIRKLPPMARRFPLLSAVRPTSVRIAPAAARALVADGALLIDVRRHDDDSARLDGALRITPDEIPEWIPEFRRDVPIVLACT